jgi:hypothetical protein
MVCGCCGGGGDLSKKSDANDGNGNGNTGGLKEPLVSSRHDESASPAADIMMDGSMTDIGTEYTYNQALQSQLNGTANASSLMPSFTVFETVSTCWHCEAEFEPLGIMSVVDDVFTSVTSKMGKMFSPTSSSSAMPSRSRRNTPSPTSSAGRLKRHHCRRCRNVFCDKCAHQREIILLLLEDDPAAVEYARETKGGVREMKSQRVCQKCYEDLKLENKYLSGRDFLQEGQGFKKIEMMGMSSKLVTLKVTPGFKGLSLKAGFEIPKKHGRHQDHEEHDLEAGRLIHLNQIENVELKGLTNFDIVWRDSNGGGSVRTWGFEGDTHQTASTWVWYLAEACRRSRTPSLKNAVELERRQREEKDRRGGQGEGAAGSDGRQESGENGRERRSLAKVLPLEAKFSKREQS